MPRALTFARRSRGRAGQCKLLATLLLVTCHAEAAGSSDSASTDGIALKWTAPDECPDVQYVRADLERLLGHPVDFNEEARFRAQGLVQRNQAGNWELSLQIQVGDRLAADTLVAARCQALADAMALKAALALDPLAVAETMAPAPAVPPAPRTPDKATSSMPANTVRSPRLIERRPRTQPVRFEVRLGGVASTGYLPGFSGGAALYGALHFATLRFELGGQAESGGDAHYARDPSIGVQLALFSGAARTCLGAGEQRWTFPICAGVELGLMRGTGFGLPTTSSAESLWGALAVGPSVRFAVSRRWAVWAEVDAVFDFVRPGFHVENLGTLYVAPSTGGRGTAGLEFGFGS